MLRERHRKAGKALAVYSRRSQEGCGAGSPGRVGGAGAQPETDMNPFFPVAEFPDFPAMTPAAAEEALQRWRNDDAQGGRMKGCWRWNDRDVRCRNL